MKFTCDRCGKRFSSVDEPMPGRVYRIRCRCGNAIQITAPHLPPQAAPRRRGGMPPRDPGPDAFSPAIPPLPAGPRSATPAGDAAAPVRQAVSPRTPAPAAARLSRPSVIIPEPPPGSFPAQPQQAPAAAPTPEHQHPQATPASVLMSGASAAEPAPTWSTPAPSPVLQPTLSGATSSVGIEPAGPDPFRVDGPPPVDDLLEPIPDVGAPLDDPFAAAAAHAARLDAALPAFPPPEPVAAPPAPREPERPPREELSAEILSPRPPDEETSVNLSVSEQYPLARPRRSGGRGKLVAAAVLVLAGGAAGAYVWMTRGALPAATTGGQEARLEPPLPQHPGPPIPPPAEPGAVVPAATPPPAVAAAPPPAAAAPSPPEERPGAAPAKQTSAERREAERLAAAERKAEAARKAEERRAEAERRAEERKAEAARKAEADRVARAERQAEADRKAEEARRVEAERKAEAARKAEADRAAAAERKDAERKAGAERRTASASAQPVAPPAPKEESSAAKAAQPLAEGLDPAEMQSVIRAHRAALESCVQNALADPATASYAGRKISLIILVAPNGRAEAALEDPDLDASAFGTCLRRTASRMTFPAFRGEPVGARVPLVLGR